MEHHAASQTQDLDVPQKEANLKWELWAKLTCDYLDSVVEGRLESNLTHFQKTGQVQHDTGTREWDKYYLCPRA